MKPKIVVFRPKKKNSDIQKFELGDGCVTISSLPGQELTLAMTLFMLELVRAHIIELASTPEV